MRCLVAALILASLSSAAFAQAPQQTERIAHDILLNTVKQLVDENSRLQAMVQTDQGTIADLQKKLKDKDAVPEKPVAPKAPAQ